MFVMSVAAQQLQYIFSIFCANLQVDVYSFGVVLWELWTGREPYDGLNYHALLHQITTSKGLVRPPMPNSPEWEHPPLPELVEGYAGLIEACWEEDPSKRPT